MTSSTSPFGPEFTKELIDKLFNAVGEGTKQAAHILWGALISFLIAHWLAAMIAIFIIFIIATAKAMLGRWGTLGSLIYNFLYFGTLLIIGLIWGPEIFVDDIFNAACAVILYPICYYTTGFILDKFRLRR